MLIAGSGAELEEKQDTARSSGTVKLGAQTVWHTFCIMAIYLKV
jgi:hypothetical protein